LICISKAKKILIKIQKRKKREGSQKTTQKDLLNIERFYGLAKVVQEKKTKIFYS
jgi:hypothetical protein